MMDKLRYALVKDWEQLPAGYIHGDVPDVAVDSRDRVYLITRSDPRVIVYERDGAFVKSWGEGMFTQRTHGITIGPDDSVYCADDGDHTVRKFTLDGELLMTIGSSGAPSDTGYDGNKKTSLEQMLSITHGGPPFNRPTKVAVAPNGELYVSDGYGNARVHRFRADGKLIQSWGQPGSAPGQFMRPHSVWVDTDGRVLVADRENDRIQIFSPDGEYLAQWTDVQRPTGVLIDRAGLVYVSELGWRLHERSFVHGVRELPPRMSVLDRSGNVLARWVSGAGGDLDGFLAPHGICLDSRGDLYISEPVSSYYRDSSLPPGSRTLHKFARV